MKKHLMLSLTSLLLLTGCGKKTYQVSDYRKVMTYNDNFTILQLTDIHFGSETNFEEAKNLLQEEVNDAKSKGKVDLIVFTGDNFSNATKKLVNKGIEFFDSFDIPFAITYGNHDTQGDYDRFYINHQVRKAKNAVFVDYDDDDIYGQTNYYINLVKDGSTKYRLFILDSNSYKQSGFGIKYDIIHEDQLVHMDNIVKEEGKVPSLAFYHIPVYEFDDANKAYVAGTVTGSGKNRENVCYAYERTDAFQRMKDDGVIGMFTGHDHINDTTLEYQDVLLSYGMKSTEEIYHNDVGYTLINLHGQDKMTISDVTKVIYKKGAKD
jgi:predicted MPP superfamily phosphohydrolase